MRELTKLENELYKNAPEYMHLYDTVKIKDNELALQLNLNSFVLQIILSCADISKSRRGRK